MSRRRPTGDLTADDRRIWARVASTVAPRAGRSVPPEPAAGASPSKKAATPRPRPAVTPMTPALDPSLTTHRTRSTPDPLEPRRQRRLARERDPIDARIDLHGYGRFQAQDALTAFLMGAQARGYGAVLVITGQGRRGGGVIRASVHEWLTAPALRGVVSGFSAAHRRHGGDGALYVTIRRV